jgi:hypothetical protein
MWQGLEWQQRYTEFDVDSGSVFAFIHDFGQKR